MIDILKNQIGNPRGHNDNKEHRAQKLVNMWPDLEQKMIGILDRGKGESLPARCAYGILLMMDTGIRIGNESSAEGYVPIRTEFVNVDNKFTPAKKFDKETHLYSPIPEYIDKEKYIRVDGEFVLSSQVPNEAVQTYGLTTLKREHVRPHQNGVNGLRFAFIGKKQVENELFTAHPALVRHYQNIVNYGLTHSGELFLNVSSNEITKFVKRYVGHCFKPKDLRTAAVNLRFIRNLESEEHQEEVRAMTRKGDINRAIMRMVEKTANEIGHTKGVCKSAYISKHLFEYYKEYLIQALNRKMDRRKRA